MKHYEHLKNNITTYFKAKGIDVVLEPSGSRGPDVAGINAPLVGEVKHEKELARDLHSFYWSSWNSTKQKFGGKTIDYRLVEHVPNDVASLSDRAKGWIAVIYGQLKYIARNSCLSEAWVIYENHCLYEASLLEAIRCLYAHNLITADSPEHIENVGFIRITFLQ
ncbi:MAG TPA: hypothetical protein PKZ86_06840 [Smithella sp.]|nr:hypothetical protein [Smithella sp.]